MSDTTLYYSPAYTNGDTYTFDWSDVTFNSSDLGVSYVGSPTNLANYGLNKTNLVNVVMGNIITSIGFGIFDGCSQLTSVTIPISVTSIGNYSFYSCSQLLSITIPNSVTSIGNYSFNVCSAASSIIIGNSVTSIGQESFYGCSAVSSIIIGNSVTSIGVFAFNYCVSLSSVTIPNSVTSIGNLAFGSCGSLTSVTISDSTANLLNASWNSPTSNPPGITFFYGAPNLVEFLYPPPTITSVSPNSGNKDGGTPVTITGTNFLETISVTFGGTNATSFTVNSETQINCVAPPNPAGLINIVVTTSIGSYTDTNAFTNNIICFKEGSKILTDKGYIAVQELRNGDLVKTVSSGFKKIEHIGYSKMYHNVNEIRSNDKLYRCSTSEYPELTEDLIITGCHSILIYEYKDKKEKEKTIEVIGNTYMTDDYYRLPACVDDRTQIFEEAGVHTIWHFSLENNNYYMNYGVYANGLLVETTSNRMMVELSGMTLV